MKEVALDGVQSQLAALIDEIERSGHDVVFTRNGQEVARLQRPDQTPIPGEMTGLELEQAFRELRTRVRDLWPDEPEFDWKEAIEDGRL